MIQRPSNLLSSHTGSQIAALHGDLPTHTDNNDGGEPFLVF